MLHRGCTHTFGAVWCRDKLQRSRRVGDSNPAHFLMEEAGRGVPNGHAVPCHEGLEDGAGKQLWGHVLQGGCVQSVCLESTVPQGRGYGAGVPHADAVRLGHWREVRAVHHHITVAQGFHIPQDTRGVLMHKGLEPPVRVLVPDKVQAALPVHAMGIPLVHIRVDTRCAVRHGPMLPMARGELDPLWRGHI